MGQFRMYPLATLLGVILLALATATSAEIYKWTDEDGNVHFGDKPADEDTANKAQAIEVDEAYKPPQRSEEEIRAIQGQQRARAEADRRRRESNERRVAEERAVKDRQKAQRCAQLTADIDKFGNAKMVNGILTVHYLYDENGDSISAAEQRRIVDELRAERDALGCP
ncbi:MAG: DUF4124 domain-containing protein [Halioglobus sp.]